ncbi:serine hydrolase [Candidatus Microgenomates bacterium]|nr:serine hydrolase [Candidatus Microgenomates bacterium]
MGRIGSPKIDAIFKSQRKRQIGGRDSLVHFDGFIFLISLIGLIIVLWVASIPFWSVKYTLPASSFNQTIEKKILADYKYDPSDKILITTKEQLYNELVNMVSPLKGEYSIYAYDFSNGEEVGLNQDRKMTAASLAKLFVAGTFYKKYSSDKSIASSSIEILGEDRVDQGSSLSSVDDEGQYYAKDLTWRMLNQSDNIAFSMMTRFLGIKAINEFDRSIFLEGTDFDTNDTTAFDVGKFFKSLYRKEFLDEASYEEMIKAMQGTVSEDRIPFYLPKEAKVSHKIGTWEGVYSDAGIIFSPKGNFICVVMTNEAVYEEAIPAIRNISKTLYDYFSLK